MGYNSGQYNAFMQGFMQGYSFLDDMYYRKRQEKRLDEDRAERSRYRASAEQRAQAGFQQRTTAFNLSLKDRLRRIEEENKVRERRDELWEQQDVDREFALDERQFALDERLRTLSRREAAEEGAVLLAQGASIDELRPYAQYNPDVMAVVRAEDERARSLGRRADSLETLYDLQGGGGLNQPGAAADAVQGQPAEPPPGSLLAPTRGMGGMQSVDIDDQLGDPEMALSDVGWLGRQGRRIAGFGRAATTGAANLVQSVTGGPPVASGATFAQAGGNIYLPESYATTSEMEGMNDEQRREALVHNEQVRQQIKDRASDPKADPRDKLIEGSRELVAERKADMEATRARWHDFQVVASPSSHGVPEELRENEPLFQMAQEDPVAFAMQYFEDRATIKDEGDLDVVGLDYLARPFLLAAETQLSEQIMGTEAGSKAQRDAARQLRSLQLTKQEMYEDYVAPKEAGIRDTMPVGNSALSSRVEGEINNPNRPRPSAAGPTGQQVRPALSTATRLSNNAVSRLSRKQIEHLIQLKDYGFLTAQEVVAATMTGQLPPSTKAKIEQLKPGEPVYHIAPDGTYTYLFTPPAKGQALGQIDRTKTPQITLDAIEQIKIGVGLAMPDATPEFYHQLERSLVEDESWIEELPYDLTDPIHQRKVGIMYAQAHQLAKEEAFLPEFAGGIERYFGDRPTARELLQSPALAARIASDNDFEMEIPSQMMEGIEVNNMRDTILRNPNAFDEYVVLAAQSMNNEDFVEFVIRYDIASGNAPSTGE